MTGVTEKAESVVINLGQGYVASTPFHLMPVLGIPLWFLALAAAMVLAVLWMLYRDGLLSRSRQSAGLA